MTDPVDAVLSRQRAEDRRRQPQPVLEVLVILKSDWMGEQLWRSQRVVTLEAVDRTGGKALEYVIGKQTDEALRAWSNLKAQAFTETDIEQLTDQLRMEAEQWGHPELGAGG